jgi:hypothetical protein
MKAGQRFIGLIAKGAKFTAWKSALMITAWFPDWSKLLPANR